VQILPILANLSGVQGGRSLSEDMIRNEGFDIFKNGRVRKLSPTHYLVKSQASEAWRLVELKDGCWVCDCNSNGNSCAHLYAAQLQRSTAKLESGQTDQAHLRCRYCGSLDIAGCGFRYGARGISRRYVCRDCLRKFSIPYVAPVTEAKTLELSWLLNQVNLLTTRLSDLLQEMNTKLENLIGTQTTTGHSVSDTTGA
jgi:DNA-directed RNA polymerase subunit RPC12/RpoP